MKKIVTLILIAPLLTCVSAQINLQQGIIAYYPMNNSLLDSSGNNLHLAAGGFPVGTTDRHGAPNGAYLLNYFNPDYFTAPFDPLLAPTEVTVSAWVNLPDASFDQKIAGRTDPGNGYLMGVDSNKIDVEIWDLGGNYFRLKADQVPTNIWTHLAMSYKASDYLKVYINGIAHDSMPSSSYGVSPSATWTFTIGAAPWGQLTLNTNGSIDDVYVYNRALSNEEVFVLYNDPTNVRPVTPSQDITVYPIPSHNGILTVVYNPQITDPVTVKITDVLGKEIMQSRLANQTTQLLNLSGLMKGLYSVTFVTIENSTTYRILINK